MNKETVLRLLLSILFAMGSTAAYAGSAAVYSQNNNSETASIVSLIKGSLGDAGLSPCAIPTVSPPPPPETLVTTLDNHRCTRLFIVETLRLGSKRVIQLAEFSHSDPTAIIFSTRMSAKRVEELDVVVPRLVRAVLARKDPRSTAEVDQVTAKESRPWRKKDGEFLVGGAIPVGSSFHQHAKPSYGIGGLLSYEMERARLDASLIGQFNAQGDELWHGSATLGAAYLFNASNTSPYVGANLGYGATWMGSDVNDANFGLLVSVGGGVEFFRLYRARMLVDARVTVPAYQIGGSLHPIMTGMLGVMLALN